MRSVPAKRHMKFVKGMDLSTLLELERCGAKYYDNGEERDLLAIMKSYDVDTIRIRLWNDPWSETGESYGAGENDLKTSLEIAKRVTAAGFGVLLNFHYSDFWADPGKQIKPKAWADYGVKELEQAVYDYTLDPSKVTVQVAVAATAAPAVASARRATARFAVVMNVRMVSPPYLYISSVVRGPIGAAPGSTILPSEVL